MRPDIQSESRDRKVVPYYHEFEEDIDNLIDAVAGNSYEGWMGYWIDGVREKVAADIKAILDEWSRKAKELYDQNHS